MYYSPNITRLIQLRIRWASYAVGLRMMEKTNAYKIFVGKPEKGRDNSEEPSDVRIIYNLIFWKRWEGVD